MVVSSMGWWLTARLPPFRERVHKWFRLDSNHTDSSSLEQSNGDHVHCCALPLPCSCRCSHWKIFGVKYCSHRRLTKMSNVYWHSVYKVNKQSQKTYSLDLSQNKKLYCFNANFLFLWTTFSTWRFNQLLCRNVRHYHIKSIYFFFKRMK